MAFVEELCEWPSWRNSGSGLRGGALGVAFMEGPSWRSSGSGICGGVLGVAFVVLGVAFVEEFWDILKQIHNNDGLHAGVKEAFAQVCRTAYKVSWSFGHIHVGPEKLAGLLVTYM